MRGVIGQAQAVAFLRRATSVGRLHHAYLFTGPAHVGKTTLALSFAQLLNCSQPELDHASALADGPACRSCRLIARGMHPDVRLVELAEDRSKISYKEIEQLQAESALRPLEARYKCYLVAGADRLSDTAANQLLKTLEEPPEQVVLLLTAPDREALLPTIVSRCQEVRLRRVDEASIREALMGAGAIDPSLADLLAVSARGRIGLALSMASDPERLSWRAETLATLETMLAGTRLERLSVARRLGDQWASHSRNVIETLQLWMEWLSDALNVQTGLEGRVAHADQLDALRRAAARFSPGHLTGALACVDQALVDLNANCNPRLVLDVALLRIGRRTSLTHV